MFKLKSRELGLLYIEKNRRLALLEAASKVVKYWGKRLSTHALLKIVKRIFDFGAFVS